MIIKFISLLIISFSLISCGNDNNNSDTREEKIFVSTKRNDVECLECLVFAFNNNFINIQINGTTCEGSAVYRSGRNFDFTQENAEYYLDKISGSDCFPNYNELFIINNKILFQGDEYDF